MSTSMIILRFTIIVIKAIVMAIKLAVLLIAAGFEKSAAQYYFKRELLTSGIPPDAASELTHRYKSMVSYNVFSYLPNNKE